MESSLADLVASKKKHSWKITVVDSETSREVNDQTEEVYQEALHLAAQEHGPDHQEVAEAATYLGDLYLFLERFAEAEVLYRRAVAIYKKRLGKEHMLYSMALRNLAEALHARGKTQEAKIMRSNARGIFG